jgi:CubicO group peptidase (beta-lactamase class C family)
MVKVLKRILFFVLLAGLCYGIYYAWQAVPIMTGYSAKNMCSCVMVAGRDPDDVSKYELSQFPLSLAKTVVDYQDSSATSALLGLAKRKAIYRKGLGCSLVVETDEDELRKKKIFLPAKANVNQDTIPWPTGNLQTDSVSTNIDFQKLRSVIDSAFFEPGEEKLRRTRAVLVVYDGKIIAEKYAEPFNAESKLTGWSMTKSITNALVGILVKDGKLAVGDPAPVPDWKEDERSKITLNDLMHASSGLEWEEKYGGPSGATNMLFKKKDAGLYAIQAKLASDPGKVFYYSSGTTNIISRIVRQTVGDEYYYRLPYEKLFYKIGMFNTVIEPDASGTFVGSSFSYGPARDWARFGLLYLNDGVWNGERILPEGWVKYTTTPASGAPLGEYGAQFWLNAGAPDNPRNRKYPDVPTDLFWADGYEGQNVFILPSKKLVVVKLSLSHGDYVDDNRFLAGIIESLPD